LVWFVLFLACLLGFVFAGASAAVNWDCELTWIDICRAGLVVLVVASLIGNVVVVVVGLVCWLAFTLTHTKYHSSIQSILKYIEIFDSI
jgi:hypothetical protein